MKKVLTIAGSDSSGGAGIQADLKTMTVQGVYGMSVVTALTAQNTVGVKGILPVAPEFVTLQLQTVFEDIMPDAIKIGMLASEAIITAVASFLKPYRELPIVLDPVMVSTSGSMLLEKGAKQALTEQLCPLASLITPNIPEAQVLADTAITDRAQMKQVACRLGKQFGIAVLVKGGHCAGEASDVLYEQGRLTTFSGEILTNPNKHGTGCTLSSAIACNLAKGKTLEESCREAKHYVESAIKANLNLGSGSGPLNHMVQTEDCH